jgi:hypothetical protein
MARGDMVRMRSIQREQPLGRWCWTLATRQLRGRGLPSNPGRPRPPIHVRQSRIYSQRNYPNRHHTRRAPVMPSCAAVQAATGTCRLAGPRAISIGKGRRSTRQYLLRCQGWSRLPPAQHASRTPTAELLRCRCYFPLCHRKPTGLPIRDPDEGRVIGRMLRIYVWRAPQKF